MFTPPKIESNPHDADSKEYATSSPSPTISNASESRSCTFQSSAKSISSIDAPWEESLWLSNGSPPSFVPSPPPSTVLEWAPSPYPPLSARSKSPRLSSHESSLGEQDGEDELEEATGRGSEVANVPSSSPRELPAGPFMPRGGLPSKRAALKRLRNEEEDEDSNGGEENIPLAASHSSTTAGKHIADPRPLKRTRLALEEPEPEPLAETKTVNEDLAPPAPQAPVARCLIDGCQHVLSKVFSTDRAHLGTHEARRGTKWPCTYPGCLRKPYGQKGDRNRHILADHFGFAHRCDAAGCRAVYPRPDELKRHKNTAGH